MSLLLPLLIKLLPPPFRLSPLYLIFFVLPRVVFISVSDLFLYLDTVPLSIFDTSILDFIIYIYFNGTPSLSLD